MKSLFVKGTEHAASFVRKYQSLVVVSGIFAALLIIVAITPFSPINITYEAKFNRNISKDSLIFVFDEYSPKPSLGRQSTIAEGTSASVRVDPVNYSSSSMTIKVKTKDVDVHLISVSAFVHSNGRNWYTAARLSSEAFQARSKNGTVVFRADPQFLNRFNQGLRQKSAMKIGVMPFLCCCTYWSLPG